MSLQLPGLAGQIEELIGLELTVKLLTERGGTEVSIPVRAKDTMLAGIIGQRACEILIKGLGPGKIVLPCSYMRGEKARKRRAIEMLKAGASVQKTALACDLHIRTVHNYNAEISDDRQGQLPL